MHRSSKTNISLETQHLSPCNSIIYNTRRLVGRPMRSVTTDTDAIVCSAQSFVTSEVTPYIADNGRVEVGQLTAIYRTQ